MLLKLNVEDVCLSGAVDRQLRFISSLSHFDDACYEIEDHLLTLFFSLLGVFGAIVKNLVSKRAKIEVARSGI